jgi:hypothetical protein
MKRVRELMGKAFALLGGSTAVSSSPLLPLNPPGSLASFRTAPPPPVGALPLEGLEVGGVGPSGGAGAASYQEGDYFVSASSYPANAPVEDRFDVRAWGQGRGLGGLQPPPTLLAAVFDGHGGWQAAEHARKVLLERLAEELSVVQKQQQKGALDTAGALVRAFSRTELSFVDAIRPAYAIGFGEVAHVGACALAAVLTDTTAVVANAGDCRAVLGHLSLGRPPGERVAREGEASIDGHAAASAALLEASAGAAAGGIGSVDKEQLQQSVTREGTPPFELLPEPQWKWRRLAPLDPDASAAGEEDGAAGAAAPNPGHKGSTSDSMPSFPSAAQAPPQLPFYVASIPMSLDNNAREPRERARLTREHPGEADVVVCKRDSPSSCYVKSRLQPTRALGDAYLKYAEFNEDGGRVRGRYIKPPYTPPYISACV